MEALAACLGEISISTNQDTGVHCWLASVKVQRYPLLIFLIMTHLRITCMRQLRWRTCTCKVYVCAMHGIKVVISTSYAMHLRASTAECKALSFDEEAVHV